jgi:hypothetical protein
MDDLERTGATYIHRLQDVDLVSKNSTGCRGRIAVVLEKLGDVDTVTVALKQALRVAVRGRSAVFVLQFIAGGDARSVHVLAHSRELGDRLTTIVLRLAAGRLPPLVTIVVYRGTRQDSLRFIANSIQPDVVLATHPPDDPPMPALVDEIADQEGCPVVLVPERGNQRGRIPHERGTRALN